MFECTVNGTIMFECIVNGDTRDSTLWQGSAFTDCNNNEIILLHNRFGKDDGTIPNRCNGAMTVQSMRVENNSISSNESQTLYISQLVVVVQPEMIGTNIECNYEDINDTGSTNLNIGNISLTSTLCNASQINVTGPVILISKLPWAIAISSSVVLLFTLFLSGALIFLLYRHHKKIWSTLRSV